MTPHDPSPRAPSAGNPPELPPGTRPLFRWGYDDTRFEFIGPATVRVTGQRYRLSGHDMHGLIPYVEDCLGVPVRAEHVAPARPASAPDVPPPRLSRTFLDALADGAPMLVTSIAPLDRLSHSHGQLSVDEVYGLLRGHLPARVVDLVARPATEAELQRLVELALAHDVCLVPYGGGTNVSGALACPADEARTIVSVDLRALNALLRVDAANHVAEAQAGIDGGTLERALRAHGFTMGHEPDSAEFSTLGGWVATRASGMKKNRYGNIEDIVVGVTMLTARGTLAHRVPAARQSAGCDPLALALGSEGNLGIITRVAFKVHRLPEVREYGSLVFRSFGDGVSFLRRLRAEGGLPASIRLVSNAEFRFGQALKPPHTGLGAWKDRLQKALLFQVLRLRPDTLAACTIVMEGSRAEVAHQRRLIARLARQVGAVSGGAANGERGYLLTFGIAYIRDFLNQYGVIGETFETTVPWDQVEAVCAAVQRRLHAECEACGVCGRPYLAWRVTQTYETGVCVYFTMAFCDRGLADARHTFGAIEARLREVIMDHGGTVSHHHGVGKIRSRFLGRTHTEASLTVLREFKRVLDPANVFAVGNGALHADDAAQVQGNSPAAPADTASATAPAITPATEAAA